MLVCYILGTGLCYTAGYLAGTQGWKALTAVLLSVIGTVCLIFAGWM